MPKVKDEKTGKVTEYPYDAAGMAAAEKAAKGGGKMMKGKKGKGRRK